jgi:hypothetical protein
MINGQLFADYGPEDDVKDPETGHIYCKAAMIVAEWGSLEGRTEKERVAATWFCRQWPEGPQIS